MKCCQYKSVVISFQNAPLTSHFVYNCLDIHGYVQRGCKRQQEFGVYKVSPAIQQQLSSRGQSGRATAEQVRTVYLVFMECNIMHEGYRHLCVEHYALLGVTYILALIGNQLSGFLKTFCVGYQIEVLYE